MQLINLFGDPWAAFAYIERFVNDGSPSGFSNRSELSPDYQPSSSKDFFDLPIFDLPAERVTQRGTLSHVDCVMPVTASGRVALPMHPDILRDYYAWEPFNQPPALTIRVTPTASQRTVMTDWTSGVRPVCVKLHCPRTIGRFRRDMPLFKWVAAAESGHFVREYSRDNPDRFGFFDEFAGIYLETAKEAAPGFGVVFRSFPEQFAAGGEEALVPAFGLFSQDQRHPEDQPILSQILREQDWTAEEFVAEFVRPLIENYVHIALHAGLIPECNAQNLVVALNRQRKVVRWFVRDMEDVWKDLTVRCALGLDTSCVRYHTIDNSSDSDFFQRRSFMFDFKLGEYTLLPLTRLAADTLNIDFNELLGLVRVLGVTTWEGGSEYFSSADTWFAYPNVDHVSRQRYEMRRLPRFR